MAIGTTIPIEIIKRIIPSIMEQAIESLKRLLELINRIIPIMQNVGILAQLLKLIQLAIPSVPGVPGGPVAEFIRIFSAIIDNIKSAIECLKGLLDTVNSNLDNINSMIGKSIDTLGSICNNEIFDVSQDVANAMNELNVNGMDLLNNNVIYYYLLKKLQVK